MRILSICIFLCFSMFSHSQEWMESLDVAKRLAKTQDKMVLMVWEEATYYPFPVYITDETGKRFFVNDLFSNDVLNDLMWEYFIPVVVNEIFHEELYDDIKGKRSLSYISRFNDDSLKIMDANGNILATSGASTEILDLSKFISRYALNTGFIKQELANYQRDKGFYSSFYLGSKYMDYSIRFPKRMRNQVLALSSIYLNESKELLKTDTTVDKASELLQRVELTELKQELIKGNPRRVLRNLKRIDAKSITNANQQLVTFLYYTAYRLLNDKEEFTKLESEISLVNLRFAQAIININR